MKLIDIDELVFAKMPKVLIDSKNVSSKVILDTVYDNSLYTLDNYHTATVGFINAKPTLITWWESRINIYLASPFTLFNDEKTAWSKKVVKRLTNIQIEKKQKYIYGLDDNTNLVYGISISEKMLIITIKHYKP